MSTKLSPSDPAPHFNAIDQDGNRHSSDDYSDKKLILFFYPKDNTPGCTAEVCNLRDNYDALQKEGFALLGVSADSARKHKNFVDKFQLPFPLLVDTEKEIITAYDVWGPKKFMGRVFDGIHRTTFVIEKGLIKHVIDSVKTKDHAAQIFALS